MSNTDDIDYSISEEDAHVAFVVLWQDGEEVAYALRQGDVIPARESWGRPSIMEIDDIPF